MCFSVCQRSSARKTAYLLRSLDGFDASIRNGGSLSIWFNQAVLGADGLLAANEDYGDDEFELAILTGSSGKLGGTAYTNSTEEDNISSAAGEYTADTWNHAAVTWDGSNMIVYLNGEAVSGSEVPGWRNVANDTVAIGAVQGDIGQANFNGKLDSALIFNAALDAEEVAVLYNSGKGDLTYDNAGNLTKDQRGYQYEYDYENRIVGISDSNSDAVAEYTYDALGRRIEKKDLVDSGKTVRYYYNNGWQVLAETDTSGVMQRWYIYGNYIDEVLRMSDSSGNDYYYLHDHLYSPAVLVEHNGTVVERYEYDAYGACRVLEPNFAPDPDGLSDYANCYLFTGRRLDILDANSLKIQYNRNRYYDPETGRWLTHDPEGYRDSLSLYEYGSSSPIAFVDPGGLWVLSIHKRITREAYERGGIKQCLVCCKCEDREIAFHNAMHNASVYRDIPEGYKALRTMHIDHHVLSEEVFDTYSERYPLTYRSHWGDLQWWHAMYSGPPENAASIRRKIVNDVLDRAELFEEYEAQSKCTDAGRVLGEFLHTIEDSYARGHVSRDSTGAITRFHDYEEQKWWKHLEADEYYQPRRERVFDVALGMYITVYFPGKNVSEYNAAVAGVMRILHAIICERMDRASLKMLLETEILRLGPFPVAGGTTDEFD